MTQQPFAPATRDDDLTRLSVVEHLTQAGAALDRLWLEAAADGSEEAVRLGEASQGVHRALIALA